MDSIRSADFALCDRHLSRRFVCTYYILYLETDDEFTFSYCVHFLVALAVPAFPQAGGYAETILYNSKGNGDGTVPQAGLIMDSTGNLYGTTVGGGNLGCSSLSTRMAVAG